MTAGLAAWSVHGTMVAEKITPKSARARLCIAFAACFQDPMGEL
jgi:hypothetical protein